MRVYSNPNKVDFAEIVTRPTMVFEDISVKVNEIISNVRKHGDVALRQYALDFDNTLIDTFKVDSLDLKAAESIISLELKKAIDQAFDNIYAFHKGQVKTEDPVETMPGVLCWRKSVGIEKVGIYIPGGSAPLFSTVLMLGIPAMIAGCKEVVLCSPSAHPAIYYAASKVNISNVYRVGGAQAIAAMAFGTEQVPQVYKIFGPGNQFVTMAKQIVSSLGIAIDMPAGPSEVAVLADIGANAAFVAADLLSQAEHGADSQVILVSTDASFLEKVQEEIKKQVDLLPRKETALAALENSKAVYFENMDSAIELINDYAAEHLILAIRNPDEVAEKIINAGSIFLGDYTPESCGDYASGTNHTLPTNGFAKAYSGVSVDSFVKKITMQKISPEGLKNIGNTVEIMAEAESLIAHKNAVTIRLSSGI
jgi:histidinol dehydrogenase